MAQPRADLLTGAAPPGEYRTKAHLAKTHIQQLILSGAVAAGGHITTRAVSDALRMSETPVREAMRSLAAEGWLDLHPHLGSVVASLQGADLAEIYALRGTLGALAVELGGPLYDQRRLDELAANLRRSEKALAAGRISSYIELNRAFHTLLADTPKTGWTLRLLTILWGQTAAMGEGFRRVPARPAESLAEHRAIVAAIGERDFGRAAALLKAHEARAGASLIAALGAAAAEHV